MNRLALVLSLVAMACSNPSGIIASDTLPDTSSRSPDLVADVLLDAGAEVAPAPDVQEPDEVWVFDSGPDVPFVECEPGAGCFLDPCEGNGECQSGWCVEHMGDGVCTQGCQEECPPGWTCQQVGTGPDVAYICVSRVANLCRPCAAGADCKSPGGAEDVCLDYGDEGSYCGGGCAADAECPWGFSCLTTVTVDGISTLQCVADAGVCPCTNKSVALGLSTPCSVANEWGACAGLRTCTVEGLSACDAGNPAEELCNGLDDDCDGDIDEPTDVEGSYINLCDDGTGCTLDSCLGELGCEHEALDEGECLDGNPCTVADHCEAGVCVGDPVLCDDKNPCTDNVCTETGGCEYEPTGGECDDGDTCTLGDHCVDGTCAGEAVDCECAVDDDCAPLEDGDICNGTLVCDTSTIPSQCVLDPESVIGCPDPEGPAAICQSAICDPVTGACGVEPAHGGYLCDDGDACTVGDSCEDGICAPGAPANCSDGNPCTDDSCDPLAGCQHGANEALCTDGNECTEGDHCVAAECLFDSLLQCDDGNPCTDDGCHPATGCSSAFNAAPCDDGDFCTIGDQCSEGECVGGMSMACNDGNPCTDDACEEGVGCTFTPNDAPCSDGDACTLGDLCGDGKCLFDELLFCDDENSCTDDTCDPATGCAYTLNSAPCDDGDDCTTGDHCTLGECAGGVVMVCNDDNPCTDDACVEEAGCKFTPNQAACDDGNTCTALEACSGGACVATVMLACDDGNQCTTDSCDPALGCVNTENDAPCNDDNICTVNDFCQGGECLGGGALDCDDQNPCTDDTCLPDGGCLITPNAAPCTDANECTTGDHCQEAECVTTGLLPCDDDNLCTNNNCDPDFGCVYSANSQLCDDSNACTDDDQCKDGACKPGAPVFCPDDGNTCTVESCDNALGCIYAEKPNCCGNGIKDAGEACDDGNQVSDDGCSAACVMEKQALIPGNTELVVENYGHRIRCVEWDGDICANAQVMVTSATCNSYQHKDLWHINVFGNDSPKRNCPNWCALATEGNTGWSTCESGSGQVPGAYRCCAMSTSTQCESNVYTWKTDYPDQNGNLHIYLSNCYQSYPKLRIRCNGW